VLDVLRSRGEVKGEITLLIDRAPEVPAEAPSKKKSVGVRLKEVMSEHKLDEKAALKVVAKEMGVSKSEAYRELQRSRR